jgi:ribonucleoside-diphosphate reductase alpha chain
VNCPYCSAADQRGSKVVETRQQKDGAVLRRRRECLAPAKHRFTTYEMEADSGSLDELELRVEPQRRRLPRERQSITHKFSLGGRESYITAGMYEDGSVGEIFLSDLGIEGSSLRGMMNAFATSISLSLQYGVPLETLVRKFSFMRFEPEGMTTNSEIPFARSLPDYIMRWLASRFLDADVQEELGILTPAVRARKMAEAGRGQASGAAIPPTGSRRRRAGGLDCPECGASMRKRGNRYTCPSCGAILDETTPRR